DTSGILTGHRCVQTILYRKVHVRFAAISILRLVLMPDNQKVTSKTKKRVFVISCCNYVFLYLFRKYIKKYKIHNLKVNKMILKVILFLVPLQTKTFVLRKYLSIDQFHNRKENVV